MQWVGAGLMVVSIVIALLAHSKGTGSEVSEFAKWGLPVGLIIMGIGDWLAKSQQK